MHRRRLTPLLGPLLGWSLVLGGCGGEREGDHPPGRPWGVTVERIPGREPDYDRVVLVTLDTLRADHVSCHGYPRLTTPFLDSLAARGVRFARAMASVSYTAPSHATMLTGLVPAVHGVLQNGGQLDSSTPDLAALFGEFGFESAAFLNVKFLSGIAASFGQVQVCAIGTARENHRMLNGGDVVDATLEWLHTGRRSERFLLWVHLYDPHKWKDVVIEREGVPGPIWSGTSSSGFPRDLLALHGLSSAQDDPPLDESYRIDWTVEKNTRTEERQLEVQTLAGFLRCIDAYDELTRFADQQVQRLYEGLEALALPGRTLWVVTADHGEGLASHGVAGHGARIYQEQLHVPLVLHASDDSLAPRVVSELVGHVDLLPTLAETLGVRLVADRAGVYEGRSLWPLVRENSGWAPRTLFAQRRPSEDEGHGPAEIYALQSQDSKYILHERGEDEFFDLAADPKELVNLGAEAPAARELRAALDASLRVLRGFSPRPEEAVPEEWADELRDLGYAR